jgi:phage baseplate assembly protein gpV
MKGRIPLPTRRVTSPLAIAVVAIALVIAVLAAPAGAAVRHIDGTVVSKDAQDHSFRISAGSGTVRIRVNSVTVFDRLAGFGALHKGLQVEVDAKQSSNGVLAIRIEPRSSGGDDNGAGDDHGGHGGGSDDGPNHT